MEDYYRQRNCHWTIADRDSGTKDVGATALPARRQGIWG
jgi:hypothetical protein